MRKQQQQVPQETAEAMEAPSVDHEEDCSSQDRKEEMEEDGLLTTNGAVEGVSPARDT